jgi:curved DNA-binding protein CbpA
MQFKYFKANFQTTIEDAKKQYYKLCLKWHPDMQGGDLEAMKQINNEWDYLRKHNFNIHEAQNGSVYTDETQTSADEVTEEFAQIIERLIHMEGLEIEICGSWLWVGGNTKEHKEGLKELGMRWASKKQRWYKAPKGWKRTSRRELSMEEIRGKFGSQKVATARRAALTA